MDVTKAERIKNRTTKTWNEAEAKRRYLSGRSGNRKPIRTSWKEAANNWTNGYGGNAEYACLLACCENIKTMVGIRTPETLRSNASSFRWQQDQE